MNENFCPLCGESLPLESINITEGVALCRSCGKLSSLSEVVSTTRPIAEILSQPPTGCTFTELGTSVVAYASLRSVGGFFGSLFTALFWNGIVSMFVLIAIAGLYTNLVGPVPAWFPGPKMENQNEMSLGMTLFLCVFLIPFVTIGTILMGSVLLYTAGKVEVDIPNQGDTVVRTGISFLVWYRRFDANQVRNVTEGYTSWESNGRASQLIVIEADRTVKFGSLLSDERREWMQTILRVLLVNKDSSQREELLAKARDFYDH